MPWTKKDFPDSMKNLPAGVRNKAIEIANALLDETGMEEGIVIATAISRARDWAANRGKPTETKSVSSRKTDVKKHGKDVWVTPHDDEWAVKEEGKKKPVKVTRSKMAAVKAAKKSARETKGSVTIQKKTGRTQTRISYTPHKRKTSKPAKTKRG